MGIESLLTDVIYILKRLVMKVSQDELNNPLRYLILN